MKTVKSPKSRRFSLYSSRRRHQCNKRHIKSLRKKIVKRDTRVRTLQLKALHACRTRRTRRRRTRKTNHSNNHAASGSIRACRRGPCRAAIRRHFEIQCHVATGVTQRTSAKQNLAPEPVTQRIGKRRAHHIAIVANIDAGAMHTGTQKRKHRRFIAQGACTIKAHTATRNGGKFLTSAVTNRNTSTVKNGHSERLWQTDEGHVALLLSRLQCLLHIRCSRDRAIAEQELASASEFRIQSEQARTCSCACAPHERYLCTQSRI